MSMISAQIDELRELAGDGSMEWVTGPIRASVLRDAANTIWQLRDDLQRANGRLADAEHDESRAWDRVRKAEAEADRLREDNDRLIQAIEDLHNVSLEDELVRLENENAKLRQAFSETLARLIAANEVTVSNYMDDEYCNLLRELGIEVD